MNDNGVLKGKEVEKGGGGGEERTPFQFENKIRILSWNGQGANDKEKGKVIRALLKLQKVDLVCLREKKIQEISNGMV